MCIQMWKYIYTYYINTIICMNTYCTMYKFEDFPNLKEGHANKRSQIKATISSKGRYPDIFRQSDCLKIRSFFGKINHVRIYIYIYIMLLKRNKPSSLLSCYMFNVMFCFEKRQCKSSLSASSYFNVNVCRWKYGSMARPSSQRIWNIKKDTKLYPSCSIGP